jgi:hypothetical protein
VSPHCLTVTCARLRLASKIAPALAQASCTASGSGRAGQGPRRSESASQSAGHTGQAVILQWETQTISFKDLSAGTGSQALHLSPTRRHRLFQAGRLGDIGCFIGCFQRHRLLQSLGACKASAGAAPSVCPPALGVVGDPLHGDWSRWIALSHLSAPRRAPQRTKPRVAAPRPSLRQWRGLGASGWSSGTGLGLSFAMRPSARRMKGSALLGTTPSLLPRLRPNTSTRTC